MNEADIHTAFGHPEAFWVALTAFGALLLPLVTLGGFLFVSKQLKSEREALETQTREKVYQASLMVLQIFIDHPELCSYFYEAAPLPPTSRTRNKILATCEVMGDHWENILLSSHSLDTETISIWKHYMKGIYETSPALRFFFRHEGYRYAPAFLALFDGELPNKCKEQRTINLAALQKAA